jgi:hypothetical protein
MFSHLERPSGPIPHWREVLADFGPRYAANGFIGWVLLVGLTLAHSGFLKCWAHTTPPLR